MSTWITPERLEPPNSPVDERAALEDRLEYQRTTLLLKCGGLTPEQLAKVSVPPSNLSLLGLVRHMSGVEAWFHSYDGQPDHMFFWNYVPGATDGFEDISAERAADDLASYQASAVRSRGAVRERGLDEALPGEDYTLTYSINAPNPAVSVLKRPPPRTDSSAVITSIVTDRLWGSIPITTCSPVVICCSFDPLRWDGSRGHRCYGLSNPFLSHSDPAVTGTTQAMREPHQPVGSR